MITILFALWLTKQFNLLIDYLALTDDSKVLSSSFYQRLFFKSLPVSSILQFSIYPNMFRFACHLLKYSRNGKK